MTDQRVATPDGTAVRVALWRAMHVQLDAPPHVLVDELGLQLAAPEGDWRRRRDMDPSATSRARASIVARARFVEDVVVEQAGRGVGQYVVLGAGLDTFALRHTELGSTVQVFEVDQRETQAWKRRRLAELGIAVPEGLRFVPVDFEAGGSWLDAVGDVGFDVGRPAVVASAGVSMYLTKAATAATLRDVASLAAGSTLVMTFLPPIELIDADERPMREASMRGAQMSGTPFVSFYTPAEALAMASEAGFAHAHHVSAAELTERYFADRPDALRPSSAEELLLAAT